MLMFHNETGKKELKAVSAPEGIVGHEFERESASATGSSSEIDQIQFE